MGIEMARRGFKAGRTLCVIGLGIAAGSAIPLALSLRKSKATLQPV
jgi:hypothetical protein